MTNIETNIDSNTETFKCSYMTSLEQKAILADNNRINVLYIDDEESNLFSFRACFRKTFNVFIVNNYDDAVKILSHNNINVLLTDQRMPNITGIDMLTKLKLLIEPAKLPIFMMITAYMSQDILLKAINELQVFKFLQKPFNIEEIQNSIYEAYAKKI